MTDLTEIEQKKSDLTAELSGWSTGRLHFTPAPGSWSAAQMLDHIVKVEVEILASARTGLESPHRIGMRDRIGFIFLDRVFRSERQVKAPASAKGIFPGSQPDFSNIVDRWTASRLELKSFYDETPLDLKRGIFRHPVSGWMTPPQILRFFSVHIDHHGFQLTRLRKASAHL